MSFTVLTKPPYEVKEYGYASFELPIDIFFRNKEEPKKITYRYDLFLQPEAPVHNTRREKLTFKNPAPEFKKKLLRAGGVSHVLQFDGLIYRLLFFPS